MSTLKWSPVIPVPLVCMPFCNPFPLNKGWPSDFLLSSWIWQWSWAVTSMIIPYKLVTSILLQDLVAYSPTLAKQDAMLQEAQMARINTLSPAVLKDLDLANSHMSGERILSHWACRWDSSPGWPVGCSLKADSETKDPAPSWPHSWPTETIR